MQRKRIFRHGSDEEIVFPMFDFNRMSDELMLDPEKDFFDEGHLNAYGAKKVSQFMAKWLDEKYDLPDHRNEAGYELWDEDLKYYEHRRDGDAMSASKDLYEFLPIMLRLNDTVSVISLSGDYEAETYAVLTEYGLSEEDIRNGGIWILKDQVIYHVESSYLEELDKYSTLKIENGTVMINRSNYAANDNGLAITVYDRFLNKIVTYKQF